MKQALFLIFSCVFMLVMASSCAIDAGDCEECAQTVCSSSGLSAAGCDPLEKCTDSVNEWLNADDEAWFVCEDPLCATAYIRAVAYCAAKQSL